MRLECLFLVGDRRSSSDGFFTDDLDRRRREISLGKRPIDCTLG